MYLDESDLDQFRNQMAKFATETDYPETADFVSSAEQASELVLDTYGEEPELYYPDQNDNQHFFLRIGGEAVAFADLDDGKVFFAE